MSVSKEQGFLTPTAKIHTIDNSEAGFQQQLAGMAMDVAAITADKANKKYEMDFRNEAQAGINEAYERNQSNPTQFKKETQALHNGLLRNTPPNLRATFGDSFNTITEPFMNRATRNHGVFVTDQLIESSLRNIELARKSLTMSGADLMSGDPLAVASATKASQAKILEVIDTISEQGPDGKFLFTPEQRVAIPLKLIDDIAFNSVRDMYDNSVDKQDVLNRFESGEIKASFFIDEKGGFVEDSLKNSMNRDTFDRAQKYMETDIKAMRLEGERVATDQRKTFMEDTALFAVKYGGAKPGDYDSIIEAQRHNKVAEGNISILTKADAAFKNNQLNGIQDTDQMISQLGEMAKAYPSPEVFDIVMRDLKKAGMSELVESTILMDPTRNRNVVDAAFQMAFNGKAHSADSVAMGFTTSKIREAVEVKISDVRDMISEEGGDIAGVGRQMEAIATYFTSKGKNLTDSVKLATDWFIDSAPAVSGNWYKTRVSGKDNVESIQNGLEIALDNLSVENASVRVGTGAFSVGNIKRTSRFVFDEHTDTYFLKHETGGAVANKQGKPVSFTITEVLAMNRENITAKQQAAAQENLKKLQSGDF